MMTKSCGKSYILYFQKREVLKCLTWSKRSRDFGLSGIPLARTSVPKSTEYLLLVVRAALRLLLRNLDSFTTLPEPEVASLSSLWFAFRVFPSVTAELRSDQLLVAEINNLISIHYSNFFYLLYGSFHRISLQLFLVEEFRTCRPLAPHAPFAPHDPHVAHAPLVP